jgi:cyclopropane-fatty-acyl-phospholipid synthase
MTTTIVPTPPRSLTPAVFEGAARTVVLRLLGHLRCGRLILVDEEGTTVVEGASEGPAVTVTVHHRGLFSLLLRHGSVGLARSYVAGWWETDDLVGLVRLAARGLGGTSGSWTALSWLRGLGTLLPVNKSKEQDRLDVMAHYDLGDEFFSLFLDPTLTYSCAFFGDEGTTLEEAQRAKLDRLCGMVDLRAGDHVLEIGSGWGSFALHAASEYGCSVTTTTVSARQYDHVTKAVAEAGLADTVDVRGDDYRDLTGRFDKVVSIEMIEAIGWRQYERFFAACADRLAPHGTMALQAIVIDDALYERAKRSDDFIKAMVFPGSTIPSVGAMVAAGAASGLRAVGLDDIGPHYAETLKRWRERFLDRREDAAALGFGEPFLRLWELYLAYCEAGFLEGRISDVQMVLRHANPAAHR